MFELRPQKGFQEKFLATPADIAIGGGAAGGGKTWVELMEPTRHMKNKYFRCVIFRRTTPQINGPGGLWDASNKIYNYLGARPRETKHDWTFPSGAMVMMRHLEHEKNVLDWQGTEIDLVQFDELTHFTQQMFTYFLSRGRGMSGINPYIRATCNPDPDSWVAGFISWWIDQETGFPIPEREGVIRYMTCVNDVFIWGDTKDEVLQKAPSILENETVIKSGVHPHDLIKSVTFIPGRLHENRKLLEVNPQYLAGLLAMGEKEKAMLLDGNWLIRLDGTELFSYIAIKNIFDNYPEQEKKPLRCITCDAARFGRDLCVIMVWKGWEVVHISIFKKSEAKDIVEHIEELRMKFMVSKMDVLIDQDGVGGDSVKLGQYDGFGGGLPAMIDPDTGVKENYKNLKTQCYYRFANRVEAGGVRFTITNGNCLIFEDSNIRDNTGKLKGTYTTKIMMNGNVVYVQDLIKQDLRAIKRAKIDIEGKMCINTKEEQKEILKRSPDFSDTAMMREYLELRGRGGVMKKQN